MERNDATGVAFFSVAKCNFGTRKARFLGGDGKSAVASTLKPA
jgi:hypothetical protein